MNRLAPVPHHEVIPPLVHLVLVAVIQKNVGLVCLEVLSKGSSPDQIIAVTNRGVSLIPITPEERLQDAFSIWGILLNRRNIPIMSMPIESMLLAVNSNFLVFSVSLDDMMGQSFASLVLTVAAAESAIGSAIFVITFRVRGTIAVESINCMQEIIVALCFIGFLIFSRNSLGHTFKATLDGRMESIQEELLQFYNPNEVIPEESNEQQRLLRISLIICGTVVESLPTARCAPKCEKTVQALLC
ncbi:unnamed protein product, partial (mitochondrion) [Musa textilis]